MSETTSAELTTRDVLVQIDRRLELSEGDVRRLDAKLDDVESKLTARIDEVESKLTARIDGVEHKLTTRIDDVEHRLTAKIDEVDNRLTARIDGLEAKIDLKIELLRKETNTRFYWMIGLMFATWVSTMGTILMRT
ncbi:MAG: hypothetical protein OXH50_09475 [Gemmatimonadetes bacterium]|nr:hypothetical protein [Gemmatimonadota bacterium]